MSELERFDEKVWDRLFDTLSAHDEVLTDAQVEMELKRLGLETGPALRLVLETARAKPASAADVPVPAPASPPQPGVLPMVPAGEPNLRTLLSARSFASHAMFARRMTLSKMRNPLRETIYSLEASRTEFHPHQFRPLLKFLRSDRGRLLIADDVGLGKTIEAGFILQEQKARHAIDRVLIVCPASLQTKWQRELWSRFREEFDVLNSDTFSKVLDHKDEGVPGRLQAIVSLQTLRSTALLERLEEQAPIFDLIIVDEAHHCRDRDTNQHRAVRALTADAKAVVFLTATPLSIRNENLFNLLRLLLPEEFDRLDVFEERLEANRHIVAAESLVRRLDKEGMELARQSLERLKMTGEGRRVAQSAPYQEACRQLEQIDARDRRAVIDLQDSLSRLNLLSHVITRTHKREVYPGVARRQASVVRVHMTPFERDAYERVSTYCRERFAIADDFAARFALITLQRQLASSVHATLDYYGELMDAADGDGPVEDQMETFEDEMDECQDTEPLGAARRRLVDDPQFRALVRECRSAREGQADSKLEQLAALLQTPEKVVVFSYFKRSLRYLERELTRRGIRCVRIDGDVPNNPQYPEEDERLRRIDAFRDREAITVLLSSEVGSEGLDFQFCHKLVNWDLPWNPMVVEQRIGRLDRLGQRAERVFIFNFSAVETIEDCILERVYKRVGLFEGAIGALEPILGQQVKQLTERLFNEGVTPAECERIVEETAVTLERRLKEERTLDEVSATLLGQGELFAEHLERTKRLGRYVTPSESELFVSDFLTAEHPQSKLLPHVTASPIVNGEVWRLPVTAGLRRFIQAALLPDDLPMQRFLERCGAAELPVTFRSSVALESQGVEFLHAQHPLMRAIARFYETHPDRNLAAFAVQVESDAVPEGDYFFLWARVNETGLQAGTSLWAQCVSVNARVHPDPEQTELLLHHMIVGGEAFDAFDPPSAAEVTALYGACEEAMRGRVMARQADAQKLNQARVEVWLAALQTSYDVRRAETGRRLETARLSGNQRLVELFEAQLRTKEATHRQRKVEVESKRQVVVSLENPDGAGFVRVVASRGADRESAAVT